MPGSQSLRNSTQKYKKKNPGQQNPRFTAIEGAEGFVKISNSRGMEQLLNPRSEGRNPKEARNPKSEFVSPATVAGHSDFGFLSDFGHRISDLPHNFFSLFNNDDNFSSALDKSAGLLSTAGFDASAAGSAGFIRSASFFSSVAGPALAAGTTVAGAASGNESRSRIFSVDGFASRPPRR
jgi:hypothetical protein